MRSKVFEHHRDMLATQSIQGSAFHQSQEILFNESIAEHSQFSYRGKDSLHYDQHMKTTSTKFHNNGNLPSGNALEKLLSPRGTFT